RFHPSALRLSPCALSQAACHPRPHPLILLSPEKNPPPLHRLSTGVPPRLVDQTLGRVRWPSTITRLLRASFTWLRLLVVKSRRFGGNRRNINNIFVFRRAHVSTKFGFVRASLSAPGGGGDVLADDGPFLASLGDGGGVLADDLS